MTVTTAPAFGDTRHFPAEHPRVNYGRIGVLLVNLGTPEATDYWSMRRYLKEFLSDTRVIETNRALWWVILNGIILTVRPGPKGRDYETIWNKERNEGPLKTITRGQSEKLGAMIADRDPRIVVDWAMRYGKPPIAERLDALQKQGCERILIVPMYPQYAAATSATVCDKAFDALKKMRWQPFIRIAPNWHDDPVYIDALATSLEGHLKGLDFEPEVILASYHGVPKSYLMKGDPYHCQCLKTTRLLRDRLGMSEEKLRTTFQSRFGNEEWLQPYTDKTVEALARGGVKRIAVLNPGFTADCLETLEEIGGENAEIFHLHGGEKFAAIPCLNDTDEGMRVIENVVRRELSGWIAA
ncbi:MULTISPECIES: ferrochelatase [Azorhizobium]|uniref:Ferrochelatase n=1 Tax=Azorhizobium caulinodans (strain ATCC 43989 / DSM 5975 / JCM 20966 / LMG 6465 / NBRC 14845 / NCIMB 13405 / ORS 571) TaxID=438753 RepID=A8HV58_AZOC5|nr:MULTISPECIES: ferrochelatase [Azorhizobium]TDT89447.1 ferrochelatase [Azorhizobium sp. AG788]BAF90270.1 ferrochelatase [Azorhizobium caulinodans ORS 571]